MADSDVRGVKRIRLHTATGKSPRGPSSAGKDGTRAMARLADGGDHGSLGPDDNVGFQTQGFDPGDHVVNIGLAGAMFHYNNHGDVLLE